MPLLKYTTTIAASKTTGEIIAILAAHGARAITIEYDDAREPSAIAFVVPTQFGERDFRLPANIDACWRTMVRQSDNGKMPRRFATKEQATRVGWRIVKDWVAAQMAIIEAGMVTMPEVFLPYMLTDRGGTVYDRMVEMKLLAPPKEGQQR